MTPHQNRLYKFRQGVTTYGFNKNDEKLSSNTLSLSKALHHNFLCFIFLGSTAFIVVVLLFYVNSKHLWSCWDGQLT